MSSCKQRFWKITFKSQNVVDIKCLKVKFGKKWRGSFFT